MSEENKNDSLINWSFPEIVLPERSRSWYIWAMLIGVAILLYSIFTANFLFGLIVILIAIVIISYHHKDVSEVEFAITENGVVIGDKFYIFKDFKHFYLVYEPDRHIKNLYFELKSSLRPRLTIPLQDVNPIKVRDILLEYMDEDTSQEAEPLSESISRRFKL